jgi:acetylornithine deacetylase
MGAESGFWQGGADEVVALACELIACDSTNPQLSPGGAGEGAAAAVVARRLEAAGLEVEVAEVLPGRPNVVGRLRGTGGGPSLMLCGHLDVVAADPAGFVPVVRDGRLHGRGASDMKGGLAAAIVAAERIATGAGDLAGDLLVAAIIDEEWVSAGAEALARDHRADAAILPEESNLDVVLEHGGFAWFEVESRGVEAAGIEPDRAVDAIALALPVLQGVVSLDRELAARPAPSYGRPSVHVSTIAGGTQLPAYPASCVMGIERCTVAGETAAGAVAEIEALLARAHEADPRFDGALRTVIAREPVRLDPEHDLVRALDAAIRERLGRPARHAADMGWMDSGILLEAGIPCAVLGPTGGGHHTAAEWVDVESLGACADVIEAAARSYCGAPATRREATAG